MCSTASSNVRRRLVDFCFSTLPVSLNWVNQRLIDLSIDAAAPHILRKSHLPAWLGSNRPNTPRHTCNVNITARLIICISTATLALHGTWRHAPIPEPWSRLNCTDILSNEIQNSFLMTPFYMFILSRFGKLKGKCHLKSNSSAIRPFLEQE
jgi:hypothetical protein